MIVLVKINSRSFPGNEIKLKPAEKAHQHEPKNCQDNAAANKCKVEMPELKR